MVTKQKKKKKKIVNRLLRHKSFSIRTLRCIILLIKIEQVRNLVTFFFFSIIPLNDMKKEMNKKKKKKSKKVERK